MKCDRCKEEFDYTFDRDEYIFFHIEASKQHPEPDGIVAGSEVAGKWIFCENCWPEIKEKLDS